MTIPTGGIGISDCTPELQFAIKHWWPETEWNNAASIAFLESSLDPFARRDTRDTDHPCGSVIATGDSGDITAELSIGYFQINTCNVPGVEPERFYNAWYNATWAFMLWRDRGWNPWYFSAERLGLLTPP